MAAARTRRVVVVPPQEWLDGLAGAWADTLLRSELAVPGSLVHLWDNVALFVAIEATQDECGHSILDADAP